MRQKLKTFIVSSCWATEYSTLRKQQKNLQLIKVKEQFPLGFDGINDKNHDTIGDCFFFLL